MALELLSYVKILCFCCCLRTGLCINQLKADIVLTETGNRTELNCPLKEPVQWYFYTGDGSLPYKLEGSSPDVFGTSFQVYTIDKHSNRLGLYTPEVNRTILFYCSPRNDQTITQMFYLGSTKPYPMLTNINQKCGLSDSSHQLTISCDALCLVDGGCRYQWDFNGSRFADGGALNVSDDGIYTCRRITDNQIIASIVLDSASGGNNVTNNSQLCAYLIPSGSEGEQIGVPSGDDKRTVITGIAVCMIFLSALIILIIIMIHRKFWKKKKEGMTVDSNPNISENLIEVI